jgi:adaptin ear-binding coat-associated protein 1/2
MADEDEFVTLNVNEVFVYKIPPKSTAQGHKASDWKDQVWAGKLQVVTRGKECFIKLISDSGKVFAVAPVRKDGPPAFEKVSDSSRYFCLRIENAQGNTFWCVSCSASRMLTFHAIAIDRSTCVHWSRV